MPSSEQIDRKPAAEFERVAAIDGPGQYILDPNPRRKQVLKDGTIGWRYWGKLPDVARPAPGLVIASFVNNHQFPQAQFSLFEIAHTEKGQTVPAGLKPYPNFYLEYPVSALDGKIELDGAVYLCTLRSLDFDWRFSYLSGIQRCDSVIVEGEKLKILPEKNIGSHIVVRHRGSDSGGSRHWVGEVKVGGDTADPLIAQVISHFNQYLAANQWIPIWKVVSSA